MERMQISKAFTLMEPGPVVFVTTNDGKKDNIMTISWTMVMDFTPKFAITTGPWNYSYAALRKSKECVISIPTVDLLDKVVGVGTCSGADTDKFEKFGLTPVKGKQVRSPLIKVTCPPQQGHFLEAYHGSVRRSPFRKGIDTPECNSDKKHQQ